MTEIARSHHRSAIAKLFARLARDKAGVSAIEYAVLLVLVSMSGLSVLGGVGDSLQSTFNTSSAALGGNASSSSPSGNTSPASQPATQPPREHHDRH